MVKVLIVLTIISLIGTWGVVDVAHNGPRFVTGLPIAQDIVNATLDLNDAIDDLPIVGEGNQTVICHNPTKKPKTMEVAPDKVAMHLAHGDYEGACL